jgi:hypothetical protein
MIEWKANMISEPPLSDTPTMTELAKTFPRRVLQPALIARYRGVADIADAVMVARDKKSRSAPAQAVTMSPDGRRPTAA